MSKRHKKVSTTLNYVWKRGRDRGMLLLPNVSKTLIDLRNPFPRYRSTTSQQLTFLRGISRNKPLNQQKLKERKIFLGGYFSIIPAKNRCSTVCQYPIVPEAHCFTYPNGALRDNPNSNACKILKGMVNTEAPQNSTTLLCLNYSIFVQKVVLSALSDLCFDVYESLSKAQKNTKRKKEELKNLIAFFTLV